MGDVYPKGIKLPKGDYTLRLHLRLVSFNLIINYDFRTEVLIHLKYRHDNMMYLEKLKKSVIFIDKSLEEKVRNFLLCLS